VRSLIIIYLALATSLTAQVRFVPNEGQWPDHVQHRADVVSGGIQVETNGWTSWQWGPSESEDYHAGKKRGVLWHAQWKHANASHHEDWVVSETEAAAQHFYLSPNEEHWAEHVRASRRIERNDLWPGIDLRWRGTREGHAKFEFTVSPGADPSVVAWEYTGVTPHLNPDGSLDLIHPLHNKSTGFYAQLAQPFAYQLNAAGTMLTVACSYSLDGNTIKLNVGDHQPDLPLVLDPEITFSTFVGSTGDNFGTTASNGPDGSLVGGTVAFAPGYPTTPDAIQATMGVFSDGVSHMALTVFSPDGSALLYSTYLGGSHADIPHSLAYNSDWGRIALFGTTGSSNFPVTAGAYQSNLASGPPSDITIYGVDPQPNGVDCILATFDAVDFTLEAATYFGGSGIDGVNSASGLRANFGDFYRGQIDIGPEGTLWIATTTTSTDLNLPGSPAHAGAFDALIAGFDADLNTLICGRTFGGTGSDAAYCLEVAPDNSFGTLNNLDVIVGGGTLSNDLPLPIGGIQPTNAGYVEGWITRMTASPDDITVQFGTYHGLADYDQVYFVQRDASGRPYAYGQARTGMPILGDVYANPGSGQYITCFIEDLSDIAWQTTLGTGSGNIDISPTAFLVSECEQVYISGWGGQTNANSGTPDVAGSTTFGLPLTDSPFQASTDGSDFYLAVLSPNATDLVYATYFGGPFANEHVDGGSSRFDPNGTVYQSVCAGCGGMNDFPSTDNAWSPNNPSPNCNMGVFKFELGKLNANIDIDGPDQFCQGDSVQFDNFTSGPAAFTWDFGDATFSNEPEPLHLYGLNGTFEVEVIAQDTTGCLAADTAYVTVTIAPNADPQIIPVGPLCSGEDATLQGSGNGDLSWSPANGLNDPNIDNPTVNPTTTTTYTLTDVTLCGAASADITVEVVEMATSASSNTQICLGDVTPLAITSPSPNAGDWNYTWFPPDGLSDPFSADPLASPTTTTTYTATATTAEGCEETHDITVDVVPSAPGGEVYPAVNLCDGQSTTLSASDGSSWVWSPTTGLNNPASQNPSASPLASTTYTVTITNLCGTGTDEVAVNVIVPEANVTSGGWVCPGEPFEVSASGGVSYQWVPGALVLQPGSATTSVVTLTSQTFTAYVTNSDGCVASADLTVNVWPQPTVEAGPDQRNDWLETTYLYGSVVGAPIDSVWWSPADPLSCSDCLVPEILLQEDGTFTLHVIDTNGCRSSDVVEVEFYYPLYVPSGFTPDGDGLNDGWRPEGAWLNGAGTYVLGAPNLSILPGYRVEIWNRWGDLIWASEDPRAYWTGGVGGPNSAEGASFIGQGEHVAPAGVYNWKVQFPTFKGIETRQGKLSLIR
jgi:hypothetical protein